MKTKGLWHFWQKIEPGIVIVLFILTWDFNIPPFLPGSTGSAIKAGSYLIVFLLVIGCWKKFVYVATRDVTLLLLVVVAMASFFWSASPADTSNEIKALLRTCILGAYLAARYTSREQMNILAWVFGISGFLSLVAGLALPSYGINNVNDETTWRGIFLHKQYLARSMTMGAVLFLLNAFDSRRYRWVGLTGFCLAIALILLSKSKSALILMLLSLSLLNLTKIIKQNYKLQVFLYFVSLIVAGILSIFIINNLETIVVDKLGKDMNFNGRVPVWKLCIDKIWERPFLGYGYAGFWNSEESAYVRLNSWMGQVALTANVHAHNGFIDLLLQLGWSGMLIFFINWLRNLSRIVHLVSSTKTKESFWMLQFTTIMFLFNLTEVQTFVTNHVIWGVYVSINLSTAIAEDRIKRQRKLITAINST